MAALSTRHPAARPRFSEELKKANIPLLVLPGSEIQVVDVEVYRADFEAGRYCHLGDSHTFTLLEFSWHARNYPPHAEAPNLVTWLREHGMTPILAHPERHEFFREDAPRLRALVDAGVWLQITVDSLLGNHGPDARRASEEMLGTYAEVVLATDAHNLRRCSGLSAGYARVSERFGTERAADLRAPRMGFYRNYWRATLTGKPNRAPHRFLVRRSSIQTINL